ncbi:DUF2066 domain-containing protein [Chiayiivirga flava]|uniref:DUF2066 domain-containing protein n=1 Tax=Chiayiivirga flava TaxID=659595 RepID=A0A7W8G0G2_9GAMM|nr:DUF2066 domain-containing protein [Chiayiivirga flava]MBB5209452.1 hypothetical protein [Chiayiivirga flava]
MPRFRLPLFVCWIVLACLVAAPAVAQEVNLYEGEVPVDSQSAEQRNAALPAALAQVLVKVSGDRGAAGIAGGQGTALMQRYRYRQDVVNVAGVPQIKLFLIASFDPAAVERLLAQAGRTVWPQPRQKPLLWLAIDDGSGARIVGEAQASAVAALRARAGQRGLALRLPKNDEQDQLAATPEAVQRGDAETLLAASARYGGAPLLIGRLQRSGAGWSASWLLHDGSRELARWSSDDANAMTALAGGGDGAADALARTYSTDILGGDAGRYAIAVQGLQRAEDYGRVLQTLRALPVVRAVVPGAVSGDRLELEVDLGTDVDGLARLLERGRVLRALSPGDAGTPAVFQLEP